MKPKPDNKLIISNIKKLLLDLGFYTSRGYWVHRKNHGHRLSINTFGNQISFNLSKPSKDLNLEYDYDTVSFNLRRIVLDDIRNLLENYFK